MRSLIAASAIIASMLPGWAIAADLPRAVHRAPVAVSAPPLWSGFYAGLNAGYGWSRVTEQGFPGGVDMSGAIGGGQIGYNWQSGALVVGIEADAQASGINESAALLGIPGGSVKLSVPWFATLRGRLGYAAGPWLFYLTAGGAYSNFKLEINVPGVLAASSDDSKFGFTGGGGIEWKFAPNWSVKGEYLYLDTGDTNATLFAIPISARSQTHIGRAGVNVHF